MTYAGKHRTWSAVDLAIPRIRVENIAAVMQPRQKVLYVAVIDADTHNLLGLNLGLDAAAKLRVALAATK